MAPSPPATSPFPDGSTSWIEGFPYPDGPLAGNGLWVPTPGLTGNDVAAAAIFYATVGAASTTADLSSLPLDFANPFTLSLQVIRTAAADLVSQVNLQLGDINTSSCAVLIDFLAGDGAANQISNLSFSDAAGTNSGTIVTAWTNATPHVVTLAFDGTDLTLSIDGALVGTIPAAVMTRLLPQIPLVTYTSDATDTIEITQMSVLQP